jgi:hypothetical protein
VSFAAVLARLQKLENPYPGLRAFETEESHLFFGRDAQVAELVGRLERYRFLGVLGVSGSGKSSLVRAGLIPALARGRVSEAGKRWRIVVTRPSGAPFESLGADLAKAGLDASCLRQSSHGLIEIARQLPENESLLVVVDQFEELFRYKDLHSVTEEARLKHDRLAADAAEFVQLLLAASRHHPPVYVVLTMRSDYLGECSEFRDLPETLNDCQYLVPRMTRPERKEAIERPLGRVAIAPNLVQRLLNDAGHEPDQLPILQHALMRTWDHWRKVDPDGKRRIEIQDYEAIGGFAGALDQHADELLAKVPQDITARIFKRLTARGRGSRERRDPARLAEIWAVCGAVTPEQQAQVTAVIEHFRSGTATFLSPLAGSIGADTYIDITHESLIRLWKKLRDEWLPQEQLSAKTLFDLADRAGNWKAKRGELLAGLDLMRAAEWDRRRNKAMAWARHYADEVTVHGVLAFIAASRAKERRRVVRKRSLLAAGFVLAFSLLGGVLLNWSRQQAARVQQEEQLRVAAEAATAAAEEASAAAETDRLGAESELAIRRLRAALVPALAPGGLTPAPVEKTPVYIQVRSPADAGRVQRSLTRLLDKAGFSVPGPEVLDAGPAANEVRFFREQERAKAEQIVQIVEQQTDFGHTRAQLVPGYQDSKRTPPQHLEIWLAPGELLSHLVKQIDDSAAGVRKSAAGRLARDHRANPAAIALVLDTLSERNLPSVSDNGRINALYFLNRSDSSAWTEDHKKLARDAIERMRGPGTSGSPAVGPQTNQELTNLQQKIAY